MFGDTLETAAQCHPTLLRLSFSMSQLVSIPYRKDIDGLRAIAVLSVILFHINETWLTGGFLGVDVFFVISGYLISLLLLTEMHTTSTICFTSFYVRRVRRIMPALLTVISFSSVFALFLMTPEKMASHLQAVIWSLFSLANVFFFRSISTDYFADDSGNIPLLHLWSLGVEEQFYFVWPMLLLFFTRHIQHAGKRIICIGLLLLLSLTLAQLTVKTHASFAYYLLPTRAWELLSGCIAAFLVYGKNTLKPLLAEIVSAISLMMIAISMRLLSSVDDMPGLGALPTVFSTALLIWTGSMHNTVATRFLSLKPVVAIGLISYAAYLWHWPFLAFIRYVQGEVSTSAGIFTLLCTAGSASLSYYWIEKPARQSSLSSKQIFYRYLIIPVIFITLLCSLLLYCIDRKSLPFIDWTQYETESARINAITMDTEQYPFNCGRGYKFKPDLYQKPACVFPASAYPSVILVGDSNAKHYLGAIRTFADFYHFSFRNLTQSTCPFLLDNQPTPEVPDKYVAGCQQYREFMASEIHAYDTVIIGGSWTQYDQEQTPTPDKTLLSFRQRFSNTIQQLSSTGKHIIILGKMPTFSDYQHDCSLRQIRLPWLNCAERYTIEQPDYDINHFMRDLADQYDNVDYFDLRSSVCNGLHCSPYFHGNPVYSDRGHLSLEGAQMLTENLLRTQNSSLTMFSHLKGSH